jgi:RNA polymerase sigma-70 factor (ECF subfamily)
MHLAHCLRNPSNMKTSTLNTETFTTDVTDLYARYRDFVVRICQRYVQNRDEAEDLAQEIFLKVGHGWQAFAGQSQPSTWLYRIAVKRQRDLMESYASQIDNEPASEDNESAPVMRRILERLKSEMDSLDSQIVYMRFELGFTHHAISDICGVSRVAITKRLAKIQKRATELQVEFTLADAA